MGSVLLISLQVCGGDSSGYAQVSAHDSSVAKDDLRDTVLAAPAPAPVAKEGAASGTAFGSFVKRMNALLAKLKQEQESDNRKKTYCEAELKEASAAEVHKAIDAAKVGLVRKTPKRGASFLEQGKSESEDARPSTTDRMKAIVKYVDTLHAECDWLLANYAVRKEARSVDRRQLRQGMAVLKRAPPRAVF